MSYDGNSGIVPADKLLCLSDEDRFEVMDSVFSKANSCISAIMACGVCPDEIPAYSYISREFDSKRFRHHAWGFFSNAFLDVMKEREVIEAYKVAVNFLEYETSTVEGVMRYVAECRDKLLSAMIMCLRTARWVTVLVGADGVVTLNVGDEVEYRFTSPDDKTEWITALRRFDGLSERMRPARQRERWHKILYWTMIYYIGGSATFILNKAMDAYEVHS